MILLILSEKIEVTKELKWTFYNKKFIDHVLTFQN